MLRSDAGSDNRAEFVSGLGTNRASHLPFPAAPTAPQKLLRRPSSAQRLEPLKQAPSAPYASPGGALGDTSYKTRPRDTATPAAIVESLGNLNLGSGLAGARPPSSQRREPLPTPSFAAKITSKTSPVLRALSPTIVQIPPPTTNQYGKHQSRSVSRNGPALTSHEAHSSVGRAPSPNRPGRSSPSRHSPTRPAKSSSSRQSSCHVCLRRMPSSKLAVHARECIRDNVGRLSSAQPSPTLHTAHPLTHPCVRCMRHIPSHLFATHIRNCNGGPRSAPAGLAHGASVSPPPDAHMPPRALYGSAPAGPGSAMSTSSFSNSTMELLPPSPHSGDAYASVSQTHQVLVQPPHNHQTYEAPPARQPRQSRAEAPSARPPSQDDQVNDTELESVNTFEALPTPAADDGRTPCPICGRRFAPEALERHEVACQKANAKKRSVFNAQAKRVKGTEMEKFIGKPDKSAKAPAASGGASGGGDVGPTKPAAPPKKAGGGRRAPLAPQQDLTTCPTCDRKFNEEAASRHIPWCKEQKAKEAMSAKHGSKNNVAADETTPEAKLNKRVKYQPPLPGKKKKDGGGGGGGGGGSPANASPTPPKTSQANGVAPTAQFCMGCGNRFPTAAAKFCFECGSRRG